MQNIMLTPSDSYSHRIEDFSIFIKISGEHNDNEEEKIASRASCTSLKSPLTSTLFLMFCLICVQMSEV